MDVGSPASSAKVTPISIDIPNSDTTKVSDRKASILDLYSNIERNHWGRIESSKTGRPQQISDNKYSFNSFGMKETNVITIANKIYETKESGGGFVSHL